MADATSLTPPGPGLSATLTPNKSAESYSPKGPENVNITTLSYCDICLPFLGLLFLLENPNFDGPISPFFQLRDTMAEYVQDIANHRQGNNVGFMECLMDEVIGSSCGQPNEKVDLPREIRFSHTQNVDITGETIPALPDKETNTCSINCVRNLEPESVHGDQECKSSLSDLHGNVLELGMTSETSPSCILDSLESRTHENKSETDTENALLLMDLKSKTGETKTKRQISEDNIVSASNKIFLKTSGEGLHHEVGKLRNDSVDETPDFEEMLYIHFDMGTEIHTEK